MSRHMAGRFDRELRNSFMRLDVPDIGEEDWPIWDRQHLTALKARRLQEICLTRALISGKTGPQDLDIAFLLEKSASMDIHYRMVWKETAAIAAGITDIYRKCKLRVALVVYGTYDEEQNLDTMYLQDAGGCSFTDHFEGRKSTFVRALQKLKCNDGDDEAKDFFTGLQRAARLDWRAPSRLLVHIALAPCHGQDFNDSDVDDDYSDGDPDDRDVKALLCDLREGCLVSKYYFCHLTKLTESMVSEFHRASGSDGWLEESRTFNNINGIPKKIVAVSRKIISQSVSRSNAQGFRGRHGQKYVSERVVKAMPFLDHWEPAYRSRHRRYDSLDDMLALIEAHQPLQMGEWRNPVEVQIAPHPFNDYGGTRWPFYANLRVDQSARSSRARPFEFVVKRFKVPVLHMHQYGSPKISNRYDSQMEVQTVSARMAEEFNHLCNKFRGVKKVEFSEVSMIELANGGQMYTMESLLDGDWNKYSNDMDYRATLHAFSHWTYDRSQGLLMVTDLQGIYDEEGRVFRLSTPAINTEDSLLRRFTSRNMGYTHGIREFFKSHHCNSVCHHLNLLSDDVCRHLNLLSNDSAGHTRKRTRISRS